MSDDDSVAALRGGELGDDLARVAVEEFDRHRHALDARGGLPEDPADAVLGLALALGDESIPGGRVDVRRLVDARVDGVDGRRRPVGRLGQPFGVCERVVALFGPVDGDEQANARVAGA